MAFSEGAGIAAQMLLEDAKHHFGEIKCAILFSAPLPIDPELVQRGVIIDMAADGVHINIPTAHIWSNEGDLYPGMGQELAQRCKGNLMEEYVHRLGHEIPGSRSREGLEECVRAIERTMERARSF